MQTESARLTDLLTNATSGSSLPGLASIQQEARDKFLKSGYPKRTDEQWKYTSVRPIEESEFTLSAQAKDTTELGPDPNLLKELFAHIPSDECAVFLNGHYSSALSKLTGRIEVLELTPALRQNRSRVEGLLKFYPLENGSEFEAMNLGLLTHGIVVRIKKDQAKKPQVLHLVHIVDGAISNLALFARNIIELEPGSQFEVIESFVSNSDAIYFSNSVTDIFAGADSKITYVRHQDEGLKSYHVSLTRVNLGSGSKLQSLNLSLGSSLSRNDLKVFETGESGSAHLDGLYVTAGNQHMDHHTSVDHQKPNGMSLQVYKGILADQSRAVFNGRIHIFKNASAVESRQLNKNLLLSQKARVDTKPELEIYASDVKANHGATVGQLNREELFYLESRGIPAHEATRMISYGFAKDVLARIENPSLQLGLNYFIEKKLKTLAIGGPS